MMLYTLKSSQDRILNPHRILNHVNYLLALRKEREFKQSVMLESWNTQEDVITNKHPVPANVDK
jgi:hypothetical protein